jgi:hypothetical protein
MVEIEFGKLNLKLNKKKCGIMRIMKTALKKTEIKEGNKFMNQYKYLGLNLQNSGSHSPYRLPQYQTKKNDKNDFST